MCRKKGRYEGVTKYGEPFALDDVYVVPGLKKKLISITKLIAGGATMKTEANKLKIKNQIEN